MKFNDLLEEVDRRATGRLLDGLLDMAEQSDQARLSRITDISVIERLLKSQDTHGYHVVLSPETFEVEMINMRYEPYQRLSDLE